MEAAERVKLELKTAAEPEDHGRREGSPSKQKNKHLVGTVELTEEPAIRSKGNLAPTADAEDAGGRGNSRRLWESTREVAAAPGDTVGSGGTRLDC